MEFPEKHPGIGSRVKITIFVLALIGVGFFGSKTMPKIVAASNNTGRKLPIYCVSTDEKKVSLSFDAAWGDGR